MQSEGPTISDTHLRDIDVTLNGADHSMAVEPRLKLSDFLRDEVGLRSVRVGCEHGVCGACTVLVDGECIKSCLMYAVEADGASIETVEGLRQDDGSLHPIQESFYLEHALQCGFCTSGFIMAAKGLLESRPAPDRRAIREGLAGNICQCTGYQNIYRAVERVAADMEEP